MSDFAMKMAGVFLPLLPSRYKGAHGARGGAPESERNGNYRHGTRTKATIELWRFIKSLR
jgi:hypothetical protein